MCAEVPIRIYVFGASGCGATTLGAAVAKKLGLVHVDSDDHYWMPTDPPFSQNRRPKHVWRQWRKPSALADGF